MGDDGSSNPDEPHHRRGAAALQLTGQQRALLDALNDIDVRLSQMYLGALIVLQEPGNGERFAQCAHTLREMINAIPRSLGFVDKAMQDRLGDRLQRPQQAWENALSRSSCRDSMGAWVGPIDQPLQKALTAIEEFFTWKEENRPKRRADIADSLRRMDASARPLPEPLGGLAVSQWDLTRDYFIAVCHYHKDADEVEFQGYLSALERFILDRLRPRTFADYDVLDEILKEADRGD